MTGQTTLRYLSGQLLAIRRQQLELADGEAKLGGGQSETDLVG